MNPVAFTIGSFEIKWYSLFILAGIIISWILINGECKKFKINKDFVTNLLFWTIIFGIIGARLYYCAFNLEDYLKSPIDILKVWEGGLAIHGGIIFGALTVILYSRKYKVPALRMIDIIAPYLLLAQSLGRWGNFFNGEVYGVATTLDKLKSIGIIPDFVIYGMNINGTYYTPLFYYESLWCLLGFIIILIIRKLKYTRVGFQTGAYMIWYGVGRFIFEGMRSSEFNLMLGNIKISQLISIVLIVIGSIIILLQARKPKLTEMYNSGEKIEVVNM